MPARSLRTQRLLVLTLMAAAAPAAAAACSGATPQTVSVEPAASGGADAGTDAAKAYAVMGDIDAAAPDAAGPDAAGDGASHPVEPGAPPGQQAAAPSQPDTPAACPADMVLIDGDYCTDLELNCLRSTYAPQNKKTICHEFASPSKCVGSKEKKRYCIDKYEYPNKKGERPQVNMNFPEAQKLCAAQGKRMCTETEWTMACEGPSYKPYPYGYIRDPNKCRGDRAYRFPNVKKTFSKNKDEAHAELERLWDGVVSGSQPECVSDYGVFDMPGNADELASSETPPPRSEFDNVTTGGPWLDGVRNQCRPKIYTHNEGFADYYLSFRCCAETDGKPTDPRSPKQIKRGEKWKK